MQEKGKSDKPSFLGAMFKDDSSDNLFVSTVEEVIRTWTKMWEDDAEYDQAVASNVQVTSCTAMPTIAVYQISYTLSKQALAASVRSMAASFAGRARYNGVAPGLVISTDDYSAEQEVRLAGMMPLGALPSPSAVADAVVYLAKAQDVTGQIIFVDGGAHLKSFDRDFMHL